MAIKRKATAAPAVTTILHETDSKGLHRIVTIANGKALYGDWTPHNQVARLGALLAATAHHADTLPQGIFTTASKAFTAL